MKNSADYQRFLETHNYAKYAAESAETLQKEIRALAAKQVNVDCLAWAAAIAIITFSFSVIFHWI